MKPGNLCSFLRKVPIPTVKYRKMRKSSFRVPPRSAFFLLEGCFSCKILLVEKG